MASVFLSTPQTTLPTILSSSSSTSIPSPSFCTNKQSSKRELPTLCKAAGSSGDEQFSLPRISKRNLSACFITSIALSLGGRNTQHDANAAILEADDDEELLERVKKDRKKRIERQVIIKSSGKETGYLQAVVYQLSKVGEAIEKNDLPTASSVLGKGTDTEWVQKANIAFDKLTSSPEEKEEVDAFKSSLSSLIKAVAQNDIESSKIAFVVSATAFEKWTALSGLGEQLKGL